jgi:hypothetical protein
MSFPLSTIYEGDVNIGPSPDNALYGYGDLNVHRKVYIGGTIDSNGSASTGTLIVDGGCLFNKDVHIQQRLYVLYNSTNLTETHIDTNNAATTVTGSNGVNISVGGPSFIISTNGNLSLGATTQSTEIYGGLSSNTAVNIYATDLLGGIRQLSGVNGSIDLIAGSGGLSGFTSSGNLTLTANNAYGSFSVNSSIGNQNLTLGLYGQTDSQVLIESYGINTTKTAIEIKTINTSGNIEISNASGLGNGEINILTGSSGFSVITNTSGPINIISQNAESNYIVQSAASNQHLKLELAGSSDSSLLLQSYGNNATNPAIHIKTLHTNGNIVIDQGVNNIGGTFIYTGSDGFTVSTQTSGSIEMTSYGAVSQYTNQTTADNQHLYIQVLNNTQSKVIIKSEGSTTDSIRLESTGGIYATTLSSIQLQSSDSVNGIKVGTSSSVPITIGTPSSTVTILGDLAVRGNTSSIDLQVTTIDDNIMVVNNAPFGTSDGGYAIKRFQEANNSGSGDVVSDTPDLSGNVQNTGNTILTITLDSNASVVDNYYNGWWVKILSGTGMNQVRKVKDYDGTSKLLTIYSTSEQTSILGDPQPIEGLDFDTIPDNTSTYGLYPCHYVMNIWDESQKEFALICSSSNPSDPDNPVFQPTFLIILIYISMISKLILLIPRISMALLLI